MTRCLNFQVLLSHRHNLHVTQHALCYRLINHLAESYFNYEHYNHEKFSGLAALVQFVFTLRGAIENLLDLQGCYFFAKVVDVILQVEPIRVSADSK